LGGLWALKLVWHIYETILRWAGISRICIPSPIIAAFIVSETTAFIRTDEQSDMARSTRPNNPDYEFIYTLRVGTPPSTC